MDKQLNGLIEEWSKLINQLINYTKCSYWTSKLVLGLGAQKCFDPQGPLCLSCMTTKTKWAISPKDLERPAMNSEDSKLVLITSLPHTINEV